MHRVFVKMVCGLGLIGAIAMVVGCVSFSPFMVREVNLPEGWPALTPVGHFRIQTCPAYRSASVTADHAPGGMGAMHRVLFRHIRDEGIAMTAPVEMGYAAGDVASGPTKMAFLYRSPAMGSTGMDGGVLIEDAQPRTFVSLGVRGGYRSEWIATRVAKLRVWLDSHDEWRATGPPRYLGYNSPFVPAFLRYGEVQIPVERSPGTPHRDGPING